MEIIINDQKREVTENASLALVLEELNIPSKGTAVALNGKIAKRESWGETILKPSDNIVIISAAYGG